MPRDNRLTRMLHVLIHMDRHLGRATSERLAEILQTNPVVVRRMMSGLRQAGIVASEKGHGGGWELARGLPEITLLQVYQAIGAPPLFNIGPGGETPTCLVEQAVDARLTTAMDQAAELLLSQFAALNLGQIAADFDTKMQARGLGPDAACAQHPSGA
jgi:DNA-binding IscR family transcriptional regulator